jgi:hypothetical protein
MPAKEEFTLDHPLVRREKEKYEFGEYHRKCRLSFDELFTHFANKYNTHLAIAEAAGVTRERIRQIYNKHFRQFFGNMSGRELRSANVLAIRSVESKTAWEGDETLRVIGEKAQKAGCSIEAVLNPYLRTKSLLIEGKMCGVHTLHNTVSVLRTRVKYTHTSVLVVQASRNFAEIFRVCPQGYQERIFVIPFSAWAHLASGSRKSFYLPLEHTPLYNNHASKIDYWKYEDAWHLLKDPA